MHFLLSSMSMVYLLTTPILDDGDDATMEQLRKWAKWDNDDYVCRGLILKDFKHTLKHKKEELTLVELGSHLRIEESLKVQDSDKPKGNNVAGPQLNIVNDNIALAFMSTSKLNDSIVWHARLSHVHFNRMAVIRLPDPKLKTLGERGIECIFVGYAKHSKAFRFYVIEPRFSSVPRPSLRIPNGTEDIGGSVVPEEVTEEDEVSDQHYYCFNVEDDPKTFDEAMKSQDGFKQKSRIDYFDTYALVACISIIRLLIAMASTHNLIIHQIDVKAAFLNGDLDKEVDLTKEFLSSSFSMKDMGEADIIFGIRIKHESNGIAISQSHYIEKVLKKFNYFDCTPVSTPMDTSEKLMPNNGQAVSQLEYSRVIGCLMYAMTCTRPDIAFVVGKLSRYTSNPGTQHWQAIQRVLKYLKKTMDYRLTYTGYPSVLEGYTDASWISNTEDNSSTSGWVFLLGGGAISWASKKQTCITGSTIESEFVALAASSSLLVKEALNDLKNFSLKISLWSKTFSIPFSILTMIVLYIGKGLL
ncbi:zinc finger, CCHC-type containing protein [Tanacetum coccineum]